MEDKKIFQVKELLYDLPKEEILELISKIKDTEILYMYAYNYNWDNGFEIPQAILDNDKCDLSTALLIFYNADGEVYLTNKMDNENLLNWTSFIKNIYNLILNGKYMRGEIEFKVPLSKIQIFKLNKLLTTEEKVFVENILGKNLNIEL